MIRTEIYANRSVEEDIVESLSRLLPDLSYTIVEEVKGKGSAGIRHGTAIWPELNVLYIIYSEENDAAGIRQAVQEVKSAFPKEGIKLIQYEVRTLEERSTI
jgi:hypothetical protein